MFIPEKNYSFYEENPKGKLTLKKFVKEMYYRLMYDEISLLSANLSYYFILSLFPMLIVALALTPYFKIDQQFLLEKIQNFAPGDLGNYLFDMISEVLNNKNNTIITVGIVFTLWSASSGIYGIIIAFNNAFRVRDGRIWIVTKLISVVITALFLVGMFVVLALVVFGKQLTYLLFHKFNLDEGFYNLWSVLNYSFPILFTFIVFVFLYIMGPNLKLKAISILPGSIFATVSWTLVSRLFGYYIDHFSSYIKTYGTIGAFMAFIIWLYITGYILIIGAEINAIFHNYKVEHRVFEETHTTE
ncbi:MAG: YihY/virulence factor BrkB family protein [Gemella haemolysans]|uniref:YihY/virulence factor BrkB family protein n=1 Tax=Gemella haemolysans TaxID=1379 RepID=UPI00066159C4|nr:YihY/virulence factor BrkB family protein [Gemella haemolysans]MDU6573217.1 YihY/virulence factor BrkB family protein [Gemella haemolysans]PMC49009.1 YihY/virulence factor BrkB family protein [Streptococcus sp. UMB1385]